MDPFMKVHCFHYVQCTVLIKTCLTLLLLLFGVYDKTDLSVFYVIVTQTQQTLPASFKWHVTLISSHHNMQTRHTWTYTYSTYTHTRTCTLTNYAIKFRHVIHISWSNGLTQSPLSSWESILQNNYLHSLQLLLLSADAFIFQSQTWIFQAEWQIQWRMKREKEWGGGEWGPGRYG